MAQAHTGRGDRKSDEAASNHGYDQIARLYDSQLLGLFIATTTGEVREANEVFLKILGYDRSDLRSGRLRWDNITPEEWRERDAQALARIEELGSSGIFEKEFRRKDGTRVSVLVGGVLLEGSRSECVCIVLDNTVRQRAEAELLLQKETLERRVEERTSSLRANQEQLQKTVAALDESQHRLRSLACQNEKLREQERIDLSREIHDVLGQELTALKLDAAWVLRRLGRVGGDEQEQVAERVREMMSQIDSTLSMVRDIATNLRPGVLDDLGLAAAIEWQGNIFQARSGIHVGFTLPESDFRAEDQLVTAMFRIFQELLTNVARHAQASRVDVRLSHEKGDLTLEVEDDGIGVTPERASGDGSLGILGMRERALSHGGQFTIRGEPGRGTRARVFLPARADQGAP